MTSVAHARTLERERAERLDVADRYLARVEALTPAEWGRLDAVGQQLTAGDPIASWRRARRYTASGVLPAIEAPLAVVFLGVEVAGRIAHALGADEAFARLFPRAEPGTPIDPDVARMVAQMQRLRDIARAQPGGEGAAVHPLLLGLLAIQTSDYRRPVAFSNLYAPVEPVIPAGSL